MTIFLKCKTRENSNFLKNGKMVISVKIQNFSRSQMMKKNFTVGIVSRNLAVTENFVKFRDSRNLHVFRGNERNAGHLAHFEWLTVCHVSGVELVKQGMTPQIPGVR